MGVTATARFWCAVVSCCLVAEAFYSSLLAAPAGGDTPSIQNLDPKEFCPSSGGLVSRNDLARAVLDAYSIPQSMVDWNDTGQILETDNARAVTVILCLPPMPVTQRQIAICWTLDKKGHPISQVGSNLPKFTPIALAQMRLVQDLSLALNAAHAGADRKTGAFSLRLKKTSLYFTPRATPNGLAKAQRPLLAAAADPQLVLAEVFSEGYFDIKCMPTAAGPPAGDLPVTGNVLPTSHSTANVEAQNVFDRVRVRAKTSDLNITRDTDAFSGLQPATLNIVNDYIARKNTFDLDAVVGYALPSVTLAPGGTVLDSIPFFQYNRDYVDGTLAPPNSSNVNNAITGVQESLTFPTGETFYWNAFFQPEYIWNLLNGAEIAKLHMALQPEPLLPFIGFAAPLGTSGLSGTTYARAVFNYGNVTRSTADPTLANTNNFAQGGAEVGASLFSKDDGSILNGFSVPVDYTYLYGFAGQYRAVQQLTVGINYTLPKTKYVTIGFSYTDGRNVDTFQMQNIYKISLGVKY